MINTNGCEIQILHLFKFVDNYNYSIKQTYYTLRNSTNSLYYLKNWLCLKKYGNDTSLKSKS